MTIATGVGGFALDEPWDDGFRLRVVGAAGSRGFRGQLAVTFARAQAGLHAGRTLP